MNASPPYHVPDPRGHLVRRTRGIHTHQASVLHAGIVTRHAAQEVLGLVADVGPVRSSCADPLQRDLDRGLEQQGQIRNRKPRKVQGPDAIGIQSKRPLIGDAGVHVAVHEHDPTGRKSRADEHFEMLRPVAQIQVQLLLVRQA